MAILSKLARLARRLLMPAFALAAVILLAPLSILALIAETRSGRLSGLLALVTLGGLACLIGLSWAQTQARAWPWGLGLATLAFTAIGLCVALVMQVSPARSEGEAGLHSYVVGDPDRRDPGPGWLPELDQLKLGVTLFTRLIPGMDRARARRVREVTMRLAREIQADPDARGLAPVTHQAAAELMGLNVKAGHYYAYVPPRAPDERLGAIVFLHGNAGNFQVMPWAWKPLADRRRFAIIAPTFGFGFWGRGGVEAVERARADALARQPIDPDRVYLAGLSDGGKGVTRTAAAHPDHYRGLVYLSPTMIPAELGAPAFSAAWRGRPILVFQGGADRSVRQSSVDPAVALLRSRGADVTYVTYPTEDHFLFFARRDDVFRRLEGWMDGIARATNAKGSPP